MYIVQGVFYSKLGTPHFDKMFSNNKLITLKVMKSIKLAFLSLVLVSTFSCEEQDGIEISAVEITTDPTFTISPSAENPALYSFENTTPNKEDFYSFWQISDEGGKFADNGIFNYEFTSSGSKTVTLTMVGSSTSRTSSDNLTVSLPPPPDDRFLTNPENLLGNAYFTEGEGDDFTGWGKFNGADRMTQTTDALVGSRALAISNPNDGQQFETQLVSDGVATNDGEEYTVSMWIKGAGATVRFSTNPGVGGDQYAGDYVATDEWTQYAFTFTANSATTLIALDMGATTGEFVVDAVEMVSGTQPIGLPSNDSVLLNGGFEAGEGDEFTNWNKYNGADRITEEATDVLSGSRGVAISNPNDGQQFETQFVSDGFETENGANYTVSMWIKGAGATVRFSTNPGVGGDQYAGDYVATDEWTQYSWGFTANSDTTLLALDMGATTGDFVIDNVKVTKD